MRSDEEMFKLMARYGRCLLILDRCEARPEPERLPFPKRAPCLDGRCEAAIQQRQKFLWFLEQAPDETQH